MPGPKKKHPKYKAVLVKCSDDEHEAVMQYADKVKRGVGPMLRSVPFDTLHRRAVQFNNSVKLGLSAQGLAQAVTNEWVWLGKCQTQVARTP